MTRFIIKKLKRKNPLGQEFKREREARGWTLRKASRETRILIKYLIAIEEDRFEALPEEPTRSNFVKKYVQVLGHDQELLLRATTRLAHCAEKNPIQIKSPPKRLPFILTSFHLKLIGLSLILLALFGYLGVQIRILRLPPSLIVTTPEDQLVVKIPTIKVEGSAEKEAQVSVNNQAVFKNQNGRWNASIDLQRGTNIITIQAKRKHSKINTVYRTVIFDDNSQVTQFLPLGTVAEYHFQ